MMARMSRQTSEDMSRTGMTAMMSRASGSRSTQGKAARSAEKNSIISIIMPSILLGILLALVLTVSVSSLALIIGVIVVLGVMAVSVRLTDERIRPPVEP